MRDGRPGYPTSVTRCGMRESELLTEAINARTRDLDLRSPLDQARVMNEEDRRVPAAVEAVLPQIADAVVRIADALRRGGRLIYVGAGTSGRLAVLDASKCPPTFGVSRHLVQALIAGGKKAVTEAVEGAEDSVANGARDLRNVKLTSKDVVVGIAASGTTPYVLGAMEYAQKRRAATVAVTSNRKSPMAKLARIVIAPDVGPEVVPG